MSCINIDETMKKLNLLHEAKNKSVRKTFLYVVTVGSVFL